MNWKLPFVLSALSLVQACVSTYPLQATSVPLPADAKTGQACGHYIGLTSVANTSFLVAGFEDIYRAAQNGNISTISLVDRQSTNYIVYKEQCTIVRGR